MYLKRLVTAFVFFLGVVSSSETTHMRHPLHNSSQLSFGGPDCGVCGTSYQACCLGFGAKGYPCDCHLTEEGSGKSGSNCGDCGTAYAACCIGFDKDGYPCQCDVM